MRVALTIWHARIAPVFDVAGKAMLVDVCNGVVQSVDECDLSGCSVAQKLSAISAAGAMTLICGAISRSALATAEQNGIEVHAFVAGNVEDVLTGWLNNRLAERQYAMPGCTRLRRRRRCGRNPDHLGGEPLSNTECNTGKRKGRNQCQEETKQDPRGQDR